MIWLPGFSGSKEKMEPYLADLAAAGFVALAYDPYQHGERMVETLDELRARIKGNIRRHFWPILARTAEDVTGVIDWAVERLGVGERVGMGGISAGGGRLGGGSGPSITASRRWRPASPRPTGCAPAPSSRRASPTKRHGRTTGGATRSPTWTPTGTRRRSASRTGRSTGRCPPDGSVRFVEALRREIYAGCPERIEAVLHSGVAHAFEDAQWRGSLAWFRRHLAGGGA